MSEYGRTMYTMPDSWLRDKEAEEYYNNQPKLTFSGNLLTEKVLNPLPNRNNIYFNKDFSDYHNWHSNNIVLPWLNKINSIQAASTDWENLILNTLDSWNNAGGFLWLNSTDNQRKHGLQSSGTKQHLNLYYNNPLLKLLDNIIGGNSLYYNFPSKGTSEDFFVNGERVGKNGVHSDSDFGVLTGNRRPTIHISSSKDSLDKWSNYFKNLGYVGAYKYLDHWVPTRDLNKSEIRFSPLNSSNVNTSVPSSEKLEKAKSTFLLETSSIQAELKPNKAPWWQSVIGMVNKNAPNILEGLRLAGNLINNERVYNTTLEGIKPNLQQTYLLGRLVFGDEATRLGFYRRAAQGLTAASRPMTSDADKLVAYQNEAKRVGDELKALGDIPDNAEIRRTSDESNQLVWGNKQRLAELANYNISELLKANAAKKNLLAQKYSADWTSVDNYLLSQQYDLKLKNQKLEYLDDLLFALQQLEKLQTDEGLRDAMDEYNKIYELSGRNPYDPKVKDAAIKVQQEKNRIIKELLEMKKASYSGFNNYSLYGKSGAKLTLKQDLLYKTAKDAIDHFRHMSKMADDSRYKFTSKPFKSSKRAKKMLQGGVAPFTIFRPAALGGENTISSQTTGSEKSSSSKKESSDLLDFIKKLFSEVVSTKGLPIDVSLIAHDIHAAIDYSNLLGLEMSTSDLQGLYLSAMLKLSNASHSRGLYEQAKSIITNNNASSEFAVTAGGNFIVQEKSGNIKEASLQLILENELNPLTNGQLLWMRENAPNLAFGKGDYWINIASNNAVGMDKITEEIKKLAGNIGSSTETIEGLSKKDSELVKQGLKILTNSDDLVKITTSKKDSKYQIKAALNFIKNSLPKHYKAIILSQIFKGGSGNLDLMIIDMLDSLADISFSRSIEPWKDPSSDSSNDKGDSNNSAALAFVLGQGPHEKLIFNPGTSYLITASGIRGTLLKLSGENLSQGSSLTDVTSSQFGGIFLWDKATFGGSRLNSLAYDHIILNNSTIYGVDLPYTTGMDGNKVPDFLLCKKMEEADAEIAKEKIEENDYDSINKIYLKHTLPPKYTPDGKLNSRKYLRFATIQVTLPENALLNKNSILSDEIERAGETERDLYEQFIKKSTGDKKFELDDGWLWGLIKGDELFKGTIFVPYDEDIAYAALSANKPFNLNLPNNAASVYQKLYAPKISLYNPPKNFAEIKNK